MADLIAIVADVIATYWLTLYWLMLLPYVADDIATY